jgi:hypothetical protein
MKSFLLKMIGKEDEIFDNPAVATQYSNEEILTTHVKNNLHNSLFNNDIFETIC